MINIVSLGALGGHRRHVDYYSSKAALHVATMALAMEDPTHMFRDVMLGHVDTGHGGLDPKRIWALLKAVLDDKRSKPYEELYLLSSSAYWRLLLQAFLGVVRRRRRFAA